MTLVSAAPLLILLLLGTCLHLQTRVCNAQVGRFSHVEDLSEPRVVTAAEFAIYRHDVDTGANLRLVQIVSGEVQYVVGGVNYRLIIFAQDGVQINSYEADVYVPLPRVSAPFRLTGFIQIS
uniref:Cystatin domain-containing protein n=1 Tax=Kalanchoe fedtschenkoi TaxID=63787 RepID=A0A7N0TRK8_KALFE